MTWGEADRFYAWQLRGIWAFKLCPESWKVFHAQTLNRALAYAANIWQN